MFSVADVCLFVREKKITEWDFCKFSSSLLWLYLVTGKARVEVQDMRCFFFSFLEFWLLLNEIVKEIMIGKRLLKYSNSFE